MKHSIVIISLITIVCCLSYYSGYIRSEIENNPYRENYYQKSLQYEIERQKSSMLERIIYRQRQLRLEMYRHAIKSH